MKCPVCDMEMSLENGVWFCKSNVGTESAHCHRVVVICEYNHRMVPDASYNAVKGVWHFWRCPHCLKRS